MFPCSGHSVLFCFLFLSILRVKMHVITAMVTPKVRKRPPTAVGMAITKTSVPVSLTGAVVSVPLTTIVVLTLGTSDLCS